MASLFEFDIMHTKKPRRFNQIDGANGACKKALLPNYLAQYAELFAFELDEVEALRPGTEVDFGL